MFATDSDARLELYPPRLMEAVDDVVPDSPSPYELMRVVSVDDGWALMVDDIAQPAWVVSTKSKAVGAARSAAMDLGTELVVYTASGKVHKRFDFREQQGGSPL